MRLARFETPGDQTARVGIVTGDEVVEVPPLAGGEPTVTGLLAGVEERRAALSSASKRRPLASVRLLAPVPRPGKFLAIGLNYATHADEGGRAAPEFPMFFNKQTTCVTGPDVPIHIPRVSDQVDFEGELGVVIGRRCRYVSADRAPGVVGGYLVVNDVSVRDWQRRSPTMTLGKSFDTHGPTGPWVVTADEIGDPHGLRLTTRVSGELMQSARTDEMIFDIWTQIATLSTVCTLEPGDIISTGTPAGVGAWRDPPRWLVPGDTVEIEIESVGTLRNPVVAEPTPLEDESALR